MKISPKDVPEIPIVYDDSDPEIHRPARLAEDGEEPDFRLGPGHFPKTRHPEFYRHVIWNREEARKKYAAQETASPDFMYTYHNKTKPLFVEKEPKNRAEPTFLHPEPPPPPKDQARK